MQRGGTPGVPAEGGEEDPMAPSAKVDVPGSAVVGKGRPVGRVPATAASASGGGHGRGSTARRPETTNGSPVKRPARSDAKGAGGDAKTAGAAPTTPRAGRGTKGTSTQTVTTPVNAKPAPAKAPAAKA